MLLTDLTSIFAPLCLWCCSFIQQLQSLLVKLCPWAWEGGRGTLGAADVPQKIGFEPILPGYQSLLSKALLALIGAAAGTDRRLTSAEIHVCFHE